MKEIKAVIQPFMADKVLDALHGIEGLPGVMVSEIRCTSPGRGRLNPDINTRIELIVRDELVDEVVDTIAEHARTGKSGDGSVFVVDVERTVRIASGERKGVRGKFGYA